MSPIRCLPALILLLSPGLPAFAGTIEDALPTVTPWLTMNESDGEDRHTTREEISPPDGLLPATAGRKERSAIEEMYSERIVDELEQFGYALFRQHVKTFGSSGANREEDRQRHDIPAGAVQDDFVLGFGDRLTVTFRGQRNDRDTYAIDNDGMLLVRDIPPIPAAGRTVGQVHVALAALAERLHKTDVYVSLDSVRQVGVLVVGHVGQPGRQSLTVFHTVLDALASAGGIEKTGSLRNVKLVRNGRSTVVDLYALLMHGATTVDISLRDGDRILVPPIGPTVAVAGEVRRPAIYEIKSSMQGMWHQPGQRSEKISLNDALEFAAGTLSPGANRFLHLDVSTEDREIVREITEPFDPVFGDGSVLMVARSIAAREGTVELAGSANGEGIYALAEKKNLSALLPNERVLARDTYPLIGVIERTDPDTLTSVFIEFPLRLVLKGQYDRRLEDGDVVHLFSNDQIRALANGASNTETAELIPVGSTASIPEEPIEPILASFLSERAAFVRGSVRQPGPYPVADGTTLEALLAVAGGLTLEANTSNVELTSKWQEEGHQMSGRSGTRRLSINFRETLPANVPVGPGDTVRVNQKFQKVENKTVLLAGEVRHPGRYDIMPGDKLSDLLGRAGGLAEGAYPEGAIFSRESERKAEELRFRAAAADLERSLAAAIQKSEDGPNAEQIASTQKLATELRNVEAVGRITVEADPAILASQPELDILLEKGDRIFIPKRPLTVRVRGEVLNPAALQFRTDQSPRDYILNAGGFSYYADKSRAFVVYPDGSAEPLHADVWSHRPIKIPPGSTIVVPRDPKPFDFIESAEKVSQIIANLALTGIWIDDLRDD